MGVAGPIDSSAVAGLALWNLLSRQAVSLYDVRSTAANLLAVVYRSVLLIRIGKQNVKIIVK